MIIKNVTVIDGAGNAPQPGMDVLIAEGLFADIGPTGTDFSTAPGGLDGEPVLDGRGGYMLPGLWESHTHLSGVDRSGSAAEWSANQRKMLAEFVRAGVTSVCDLGGPLTEVRWLREAAGADAAAPSLFFAGPCFTGRDGWPLHVGPSGPESTDIDTVLALEMDSADAARQHVQKLVDEVDYVKCIYDSRPGHGQQLPRAALEAVIAAAHDAGKKVLVHVAAGPDIRAAANAGADAIEHCFLPQDPTDINEAKEIADLLATTGTLYCPTIVTWEQIGRIGDPAYLDELIADGIVTPDDVAEITARPLYGKPFTHHPADECEIRFDYTMRTLRLFHDAGVKLVAGSDVALAMPTAAHALLRELQLFAKAGIPNAEIIATATSRAAEKIGKQDRMGTVAVGTVADAILLDANPLNDITNLTNSQHLRAVIKSGDLVHQ